MALVVLVSFLTTQLNFLRDQQGVLTIFIHGKTVNSGWKIKWFAEFRLGSLENMGCNLVRSNFCTPFSLLS